MSNANRLNGKVAVVTGSSAGIGLASAAQLAALGATVVLNGRDEARLDAAADHVRAGVPGADVRVAATDVGTAEGCAALVAHAPSADILINNVGVYDLTPFFTADDEVWRRYFEVNMMSAVRLSRAYLPGMTARGWGRIVLLSSEAAMAVPPDMIPYAFTKTGLLTLSRGLAKVAAGSGVTVNAVLPGPTYSEGLIAMLNDGAPEAPDFKAVADAFVRTQRTASLIQRTATVEEVANLVTYVCSPLSSATTGAALRVDGGAIDSIL